MNKIAFYEEMILDNVFNDESVGFQKEAANAAVRMARSGSLSADAVRKLNKGGFLSPETRPSPANMPRYQGISGDFVKNRFTGKVSRASESQKLPASLIYKKNVNANGRPLSGDRWSRTDKLQDKIWKNREKMMGQTKKSPIDYIMQDNMRDKPARSF